MLKEDTTQCAEEQKTRNILFTVSRNILPVTVCLPSNKHAPQHSSSNGLRCNRYEFQVFSGISCVQAAERNA
jgi:hypothetical protein